MFYNCGFSSGGNMSISNYNTHNLQIMEAMFMGCSSLRDVPLSSFTTSRVTNMQNLFNGCYAAAINIDNFVISSGTNLTGAFVNAGPSWGYTIYCRSEVETLLRQLGQQDATVIDLTKASFSRPTSK
jgi:surface protein